MSRTTRSDIIARLRSAGCVFAEDEARLLIDVAFTPDELAAMVDRRVAGEPLEYVLGWAEFCDLRIAVDPGVFVPRRRTELLARRAVAFMPPLGGVAVDLCCGSGAVGAVLAHAVAGIELYSVDADPAAVRCARRNLPADSSVLEGDLFHPLPAALRGRVDVLVANAPYVPTHSFDLLPPEARLYEPALALDGGADGLDVLRRVIAGAPDWLAPAGHLLVETSERQAPVLAEAIQRSGLVPRAETSDELGATIVIGSRPSPRRPSSTMETADGPRSGRWR